jgi:hypothetical protein
MNMVPWATVFELPTSHRSVKLRLRALFRQATPLTPSYDAKEVWARSIGEPGDEFDPRDTLPRNDEDWTTTPNLPGYVKAILGPSRSAYALDHSSVEELPGFVAVMNSRPLDAFG